VKEFFGSTGFLFVVVGVVVLILLKELWKARSEGRKAMVYSLLLTLTVVVIATAVVLYSLEI
jgi:predicted membrane channel-forming protein YqfA (hemolysin III family)|tara:strand:+ start:489 stop:674 length:186 start_codon:yes stop_codon:yes gene_type:complete